MTGTAMVTEVVSILTAGLTSIGTAMGGALSSMATSLFLSGTGENETLSVFAVIMIVFCSVSLGLSLFRWVLNFITSWGNRNR